VLELLDFVLDLEEERDLRELELERDDFDFEDL
jgi:hypothetical protein